MATLTPALTNGTVADADAVMALLNALNADLGMPKALTGAVAATRYVGGVASVAPTTGTFAVGDFVIAQSGGMFVCTVAGTPGTWVAVGGSAVPVGSMVDYSGIGDPADTNWLLSDGRAVSRSTYSALFAALCPTAGGGTVTITLASPGVFTTASAHGLQVGDAVYLTTTGGLPTGLAQNTVYYVASVPSTTTFTVAATAGGSAINTSVGQSGTHTVRRCPYGIGDGSTTFNLPDTRGRVLVGADNMKTAAGDASRLTNQTNKSLGGAGGTDVHTLTTAQLPTLGSHSHTVALDTGTGWIAGHAGSGDTGTGSSATTSSVTTGGSGGSHPNMQPYLITHKLIRVYS